MSSLYGHVYGCQVSCSGGKNEMDSWQKLFQQDQWQKLFQQDQFIL